MIELPSDLQVAAENIQACYQKLSAESSNVAWELLRSAETVFEWDHYPKGDVFDKAHGCQYYYHSHSSKDSDRLPEHGHFHLFVHHKMIPQAHAPLYTSSKFRETEGKKDYLSHVIAIAMNEYGYPKGFFTVNHWMVTGLWYSAEVLCQILDRWVVDIPDSPYATTNAWVTNMVKLFKPQIQELLYKRDEVIEEFRQNSGTEDVFMDKNLEVTSILRFSEDAS